MKIPNVGNVMNKSEIHGLQVRSAGAQIMGLHEVSGNSTDHKHATVGRPQTQTRPSRCSQGHGHQHGLTQQCRPLTRWPQQQQGLLPSAQLKAATQTKDIYMSSGSNMCHRPHPSPKQNMAGLAHMATVLVDSPRCWLFHFEHLPQLNY